MLLVVEDLGEALVNEILVHSLHPTVQEERMNGVPADSVEAESRDMSAFRRSYGARSESAAVAGHQTTARKGWSTSARGR